MTRGRWFDGVIAIERPVTVAADADSLIIIDGEGRREEVEASDLVLLERRGDSLRLGHRDREGWRLVLLQPIEPAVMAVLPVRTGSLTARVSRRTMVVLVSLTVVASVLAGLLVFAPQILARHLPMSLERKIGSAYELPASFVRCDDRDAQAALNALVDRLDPQARRDGFTIELLEVDAVNAAALPGGRMVLFKGLVDEAGGAEGIDAVAGVLAHEIAHVRRRHVATAMVRELGLSAIITAMGGGAVAGNAGGLLSMSYGRRAEAEADRDAVAALRRAGIDPRPTANFFHALSDDEAEIPEWISSHPASSGRAAAFRASYSANRSYSPSLVTREATAIAKGCGT